MQQQQWPQQQAHPQYNNNQVQRRPQFDPIPMIYTELFPSLVDKKHIQTRPPPPVLEKLPYWYTADQFCAYHQGAPRNNLED